jgi:hypothetical protein
MRWLVVNGRWYETFWAGIRTKEVGKSVLVPASSFDYNLMDNQKEINHG